MIYCYRIIIIQIYMTVMTIHDFKHSCVSLLINSGTTINVVAKYLGHTKIDETLNTYSHLFKNQMNEIVNIIDKLN